MGAGASRTGVQAALCPCLRILSVAHLPHPLRRQIDLAACWGDMGRSLSAHALTYPEALVVRVQLPGVASAGEQWVLYVVETVRGGETCA